MTEAEILNQTLGTNQAAQTILRSLNNKYYTSIETAIGLTDRIIDKFYDWKFPFPYTTDGGGDRRWRSAIQSWIDRNPKLIPLEEFFEQGGTDGTFKEEFGGIDQDKTTDNNARKTTINFGGVDTTTSESTSTETTEAPVAGQNEIQKEYTYGKTRTYSDGRTWDKILADALNTEGPVYIYINGFSNLLLEPSDCFCDYPAPSVQMKVAVETLPSGSPAAAVIQNNGTPLNADWELSLSIPQGPQGGQGVPGKDGKDGAPGPQGTQGNPGAAATIRIGTVSTGAPGSAATVTNAGTENAAVFNFSIPRGEKGDRGPQGLPGEGVETLYEHIKFYVSPEDDDPAAIFGGDWARIEGQFVFGCDASHASWSAGGQENVTLTVGQMPSHSHQIYNTNGGGVGAGTIVEIGNVEHWGVGPNKSYRGDGIGPYGAIQNTGGGQAHNNMPPYLAMYMWYRVS